MYDLLECYILSPKNSVQAGLMCLSISPERNDELNNSMKPVVAIQNLFENLFA